MLELEPSAQTKPQDNTASNTITKITPSDSSSFGMLDLEIVTPRPSQNKTEKHDSTADTTQTDNTTKGKSSNEAGFASSSLADKFEFFNDQDKVTERPPFFGIQTEGRFDQISYITATFICSLTSWWLIFVSILFSASLILVIPVYLAFIRIQILRLHDLNLPWYWVMIHPIVNLLIVLVTLEGGFSSLITWHYLTISMAYSMVPWRSLTFVAALINSLFFIFMSIKRGSLGENDYGAPVVDLVATQEEGNKFLSGSVIGMVFSCVLLLSIVLLRPASPNAGGLPLTVQQLNAHTPRSGEFIQFDAYVAWHASDCTCSPFDYTCLPCTEGVAIFSDKKPSDTLDMQTHYDLINGRNKEGHKEYILIMDPPDNIKAGKKYRFTVYSSAQAGSSKYTISHQVKSRFNSF